MEKVNIELSKNEALVLFEFLARFNESDHPNLFEDQAEQRIMWNLEAILETKLIEPFYENYLEIIQQARAQVRDSKE
ncbi:hypothetical protein BKI52_38120 [marine bacterium AO1-C]|nr:hypothetical protein BKI52_38120 [marine bacterium AO1-C]